jgi:ATP-dependent RNA helicase RhlE
MTHIAQIGQRFADLGLSPKLLALVEAQQFITPTPIQHQAIPPALAGQDVVGIAQTGTGKTLAFGLPMIQRISQFKGQGLVLIPTRELALQVDETLQKIGRPAGLKTAVIIGGASMGNQVRDIKRNPHIIIATPGRLVDHLEQKTFNLNHISVVVLDEADRMFDIGFAPQIKRILSLTPKDRQTMLFSATMPKPIAEMAAHFMKAPLRIEVAPAGTSAAKVEQEVFIASKESKLQLLDKVLADNPGTVLVFSRTKFGAKRITSAVINMGHTAVEIHSNRSLAQRKAALDGFKSGKYRVLVATDIAARGIDVKNITLVVNYDLPDNPEDYVHRIGRTGRAGGSGKAISFAAPEERMDLKTIERLIRKTLPILALPVLPPKRAHALPERGERRNFGMRGGQHGRSASAGGRGGRGQRSGFGGGRSGGHSRGGSRF